MKECFCECGATVPRFPLGYRSVNKRGRLVAQQLAWAKRTAIEQRVDHDPDLQVWIADGKLIVVALREAVHGERNPRTFDERTVRRWQAVGRGLERGMRTYGFEVLSVRRFARQHRDLVRHAARAG